MLATLPVEITKLPEHVAIIMDGNRRWADKRGIPHIQGHEAGLENVRRIAGVLNDYHIGYATVYVFSTENWNRSKEEVDGLMMLLQRRIDEVTAGFDTQNIRLKHLGSMENLPSGITSRVQKAIDITKNNTGLTLNLAFNYGGRADIVNAARRIIREGVPADKVDEKIFGGYLYTNGIPDVDLLIRPGGELRLSNFLLWQSAYAEFYFSDVLWPDFEKAELDKALLAFSNRQRRFGRF
jgi:undecaprenyl diphosphate synthase